MKSTIDAAGRLMIPRAVRRQAGLQPGTVVDVRWQDGHIHVEPLTLPVRLVREGRLLVAVPESTPGPLLADTVEATRQALAEERGGGT
jgi:AbrB family looped-hinge helix DNA binding protein